MTPWPSRVSTGLATLLWLSHLLGWLGLFSGQAGPAVAIAPIALGCVLALHQLFTRVRGGGIELSLSPFALITAPGIALLLVAACNPPGALWSSEFGAYDVLEYHLQLPQEWLAQGRIAPLDHNVYSYLPSYLESAFTHLGAMTLAPLHAPQGAAVGLCAGEGYRLLSCQLLHAGFAIIAAWLTARLVRSLVPRTSPQRPTDPPRPTEAMSVSSLDLAPPLTFSLLLLTPWTIVTGSMAYNEMALLALFAGALLAASDTKLAPLTRSILTGLLVGAATSVKPTALLFCGLPAAIFLLATPSQIPIIRRLALLTLPGALAGLAMLAPWLIRNYLAAHNPVFPFAASLLGHGDWTLDQANRYAAAHQFHGPLLERLRLLFLPDPSPTQQHVSAHRGLLHPQFGLLFPITLLAIGMLVLRAAKHRDDNEKPTRSAPILLTLSLAVQLALWLATTHLQARFLMPLMIPAAALCALAVTSLFKRSRPLSRTSVALLSLLPLTQLAHSCWIFSHERGGEPNSMLIGGPAVQTGQFFRDLPPAELRTQINNALPELFVNLALPPTATVYLLGDSTPLYLTRPVLYNTTYDTWPISGDPATWSATLRARHVDFVLVNLGEIARLARSGWLPPDVTLRAVTDWLQRHTIPVRTWDDEGVYLVRPIEPPAAAKPPDKTPPPK